MTSQSTSVRQQIAQTCQCWTLFGLGLWFLFIACECCTIFATVYSVAFPVHCVCVCVYQIIGFCCAWNLLTDIKRQKARWNKQQKEALRMRTTQADIKWSRIILPLNTRSASSSFLLRNASVSVLHNGIVDVHLSCYHHDKLFSDLENY